MPGAIAMINVVGNLARGRPPRRPRPPLGDGGRHQDGCPAAARARAAVKPFECCRPHRFRPGTKASNTPNLEATTGRRRRNFKAASNSPVRKLMPVILPLGRARDATKPHLTGILGECRRRSGGLLCRPRPQGGEAPRLVFQQPAGPSCNWYHAAQTRRVSPPLRPSGGR